MHATLKGSLILGVLLSVIFLGFAQSPVYGQGLPTIRFTGVVYPADAKDIKGGLTNVKIFIEKKEWILSVTKAQDVLNPDITDLEITGNMTNRLTLQEGVKGTLAPFQKPDILRKTITIQGLADFPAQLMEVNLLTVGPAGK
jgi:hypothetical protein